MKNKIIFFVLPVFSFISLSGFPFSCVDSIRDGGVFRSLDRGENWEQKVAIDKKQTIATASILTITIDPRNEKIIYLGTRAEGIYKSMDGGEIWYHLNDPRQNLDNRANVYDIAVDSQNSGNIFIGAYQNRFGRLLRSGDAGKNWEEVYRVSREGYAVFVVEIDPFDSAVIYMGTAEGGLLKSVDYGKNWKIIRWFDDVISDIKVNPYNDSEVFVGTYQKGVYKTNNKGQTWRKLENLSAFSESNETEVLVMDKKNPNTLYSGSKTGLLKSEDGGENWQKINIVIPPESLPIQAIALDPWDSMRLYYSAGNVIYSTNDSGRTWAVHPLVSQKNVNVIAINPIDSSILYAGMHE